jgi:hypothetical protein
MTLQPCQIVVETVPRSVLRCADARRTPRSGLYVCCKRAVRPHNCTCGASAASATVVHASSTTGASTCSGVQTESPAESEVSAKVCTRDRRRHSFSGSRSWARLQRDSYLYIAWIVIACIVSAGSTSADATHHAVAVDSAVAIDGVLFRGARLCTELRGAKNPGGGRIAVCAQVPHA